MTDHQELTPEAVRRLVAFSKTIKTQGSQYVLDTTDPDSTVATVSLSREALNIGYPGITNVIELLMRKEKHADALSTYETVINWKYQSSLDCFRQQSGKLVYIEYLVDINIHKDSVVIKGRFHQLKKYTASDDLEPQKFYAIEKIMETSAISMKITALEKLYPKFSEKLSTLQALAVPKESWISYLFKQNVGFSIEGGALPNNVISPEW